MVPQNVVYENGERCGDDKRQQRQHESAGGHATQYAPRPARQGSQLLEQVALLAAGSEILSALELQRYSTVAFGELFGGDPTPPSGRIIEIEMADVEPFDDNEMAKLPKHDQRKFQLF